jgi:thymidylate kinase
MNTSDMPTFENDYDVIIFEALDRAGKTTTKKCFEKLTLYKYITIDRMYLTAICYEKIKKRDNNIDKYIRDFKMFCNILKVLVVYIKIDNGDLIKERIIRENEKVLKTEEVDDLINIFNNTIEELKKEINFDLCVLDGDNCRDLNDFNNLALQILKRIEEKGM